MKYTFVKDGKSVAWLEMPDDIECFAELGGIMEKTGAQYVTMAKED